MRRTAIGGGIGTALALAGCAAPGAVAPVRPPRIAIPYSSGGLERVIGQDAPALTRLFGQPDADLTEGAWRKLQFTSPICVLDTYLTPKASGSAPTVSYIDAREPDGSPIDRASCVAALTRRDKR